MVAVKEHSTFLEMRLFAVVLMSWLHVLVYLLNLAPSMRLAFGNTKTHKKGFLKNSS